MTPFADIGNRKGRDKVMWKRKSILLAGLLAGVSWMLAGCGDDLSMVVPVIGSELSSSEVLGETESLQETESMQETEVVEEEVPQEDTEETQGIDKEGLEGSLPEEVRITISAAGDCSLGNYFEQGYSNSFDQTYDTEGDPEYFLRNVKEIFAADDMTIVNLEGVLTESEVIETGRTFNIKGKPSYVEILTAGSVEAVSMGNNHRLDYGVVGSQDTTEVLEEAGIVYAYDDVIGMYEVKGIKIGYVSVNEVAWGFGCEKFIKEGIAKLQEQGADLILACCHWGVEKDNYIEEYQSTLGRICIDAGADLVLGHHPHVLQGIDMYNGKYIVYSLANFSFGANRNPADKDTMIFQQTFTFVDGEKQEETEARVIPCSVSSVKERNNYQPTPLEQEDAERVIGRLNTYSEEFGVVIEECGRIRSAER